jgi:hypothetical protein
MSAIDPVLDQCIQEMRAGRGLEECLSDHPAQAEELRPYLVMAQQLLEIPGTHSSDAEFIAGRQRMLSRLHHQHPKSASGAHFIETAASAIQSWMGKGIWNMNSYVRHLITVLLVCLLAGIIVVKASANNLPGSPLYAIKTGWEKTRLALTFDQGSRTSLINQFQAERKREITSLVQLHRSQVVNFTGKLTQLSDHEWVVDGLTILINDQTLIHGSPGIDDLVTIAIQTTEDGTLLALQVDPETPSEGTLEPTLRNSVGTLENATGTPIRKTPIPSRKTSTPGQGQTLVPTQASDLSPTQSTTNLPTSWDQVQTLMATMIPDLTGQPPSPTDQHSASTEPPSYPTYAATWVSTSTTPPISAPILTLMAPRRTPVSQPTIAFPTMPPPPPPQPPPLPPM